MQKNVTGQKAIVFAFNATTNVPVTGDAANLTAYFSKDFGTVTVLGDTSATEMDATNAKGYYLFDVTQTESNADVILVSAKSTTANVVAVGAPATIFTTPASFTAFVTPPTAAATATAVWQDTTAGDFTVASSIGKTLYIANVAPGGSGGLLISGSNAGTTTFGALTVTGATTHTGNVVLSDGLTISAPSTANRAGITVAGTGTGAALSATGGTTGQGFLIVGGGTSGDGIKVTTTSGHGVNLAPAGSSMHGMLVTGGTGGTSDGLKLAAGTGGVGARYDTLTASGATTFAALSGTTLTLSGAVAFQSTFAVTTSTALAALSCTTLTASGAVAFQSTFATTGTATFNALTVTNATTLSGAVSLGSTLSTAGTVTLNALTVSTALTVSGATTLTGAVTGTNASNDLRVNGAVPGAAGGLFISGANAGTTTFGALTVTGATTLTGAVAAANASNNIVGIDVAKISGDASAADNCESFFDGTGYAGTNNVIPVVTTTATATNLTNLPPIPANWLTAAGTAADFTTEIQAGLSTASALAVVSTAVVTDIPASLATIAGYVDTEVGAIKTKTDQLTFTTANRVDSTAQTGLSTLDAAGVRMAVGLGSANLDTQLDALPTNTELAAALVTGLTTALAEGYRGTNATGSVRDLLYEVLQNVTEFAISGTTKTVKKINGTTAKTYTLDSSTAPTSITETT